MADADPFNLSARKDFDKNADKVARINRKFGQRGKIVLPDPKAKKRKRTATSMLTKGPGR